MRDFCYFIKAVFLAVLFLSFWAHGFLFSEYVHCEPMGEELIVEGEGEAPVEKEDMASARNRALEDAFQKAFEKALYSLLSSSLPMDRAREGILQLLPKQKKYLIRYRILSEVPTPQIYFMSVQAVYSVVLLKKALSISGLREADGQYPVRDIIIKVHNVYSYLCYHDLTDGLLKKISGLIFFMPREIYGTEVVFLVRFRGDTKKLAEAFENWKNGDFRIGSVAVINDDIDIHIVFNNPNP